MALLLQLGKCFFTPTITVIVESTGDSDKLITPALSVSQIAVILKGLDYLHLNVSRLK